MSDNDQKPPAWSDANPWRWLLFPVEMTDAEIAEALKPFEPVMIDRTTGEHGTVGFYGATINETLTIQDRIKAFEAECERRKAEKAKPWSFDADAFLRSKGQEPNELRALQRRKRRDNGDVENSHDWVIKHRLVR